MRRRSLNPAALITVVAGFVLLAAACGSDGGSAGKWKSVETLSDGSDLIRYSGFPRDRLIVADVDLRIGSADAEDAYILGDVRGIDAGRDGTIYIFDRQASEIRAFDSAGTYLRTVASSGNGPGEITEANGMQLVGDTVLWVFDYDRRRINAFGLGGGEVASFTAPSGSWGYSWTGAFDQQGRFRKEMSSNYSRGAFSRQEGLRESVSDAWLLTYDYRSGARDSLYLGRRTDRGYVTELNNGHMVMGIPHEAEWITALDPAGGIWRTYTDIYRLYRLDAVGDTVITVEADVDALSFTAADRRTMLERVRGLDPDILPAFQKALEFSPDVIPFTLQLTVDEESRLWLMRAVPDGENQLYDVFDRHGDYLASVRLNFRMDSPLPIRIRDNRIYALSPDSLGAPTVVRTRPLNLDVET